MATAIVDSSQPVAEGTCFSCGMPYVPDVGAAAWRQPYHHSGRVPPRSLALMVGVGVPAAIAIGVIGYFGGSVARAIGIAFLPLSAAIATGLQDLGQVGDGVGLAIALMPALLIGVGYPALLGWAAGSVVARGSLAGRNRRPTVAVVLGLAAGAVAYAAFIVTALQVGAPLHESSRILEVVEPPFSYLLVAVDGLIVLWTARWAAREATRRPFCEPCGKWYRPARTTAIPIVGATPLVEALAGGSAAGLRAVPPGASQPARIRLDLSRCDCGQTDYVLTATVHWGKSRAKRGGTKATSPWFSTTIPAALGAEIERWWTPQAAAAA